MLYYLYRLRNAVTSYLWAAPPEPCALHIQLSQEISNDWQYEDDPEFHTSFAALKKLLKDPQLMSDEVKLKKSLRDFLSKRDSENKASLGIDYDFRHADAPISKLCQRIATWIANDDEPILWVLKPSLDKTTIYINHLLIPGESSEKSLMDFSESRDYENKRCLKDLKRFVPVKNGTQILDAALCCEMALSNLDHKFNYQAYRTEEPGSPVLSRGDMNFLRLWGQDVAEVEILLEDSMLMGASDNAQISDEKVWVSSKFNAREFMPGTLGYELCVLQECLANGGITRRDLRDDNVDILPVTWAGIFRFKRVWDELTEAKKNNLKALSVTDEYFLFRVIIHSILSRVDKNYYFPNEMNIQCVDSLSKNVEFVLMNNLNSNILKVPVVSEIIYPEPTKSARKEYFHKKTKETEVNKLRIRELHGKFHAKRESNKRDFNDSLQSIENPHEKLFFIKGVWKETLSKIPTTFNIIKETDDFKEYERKWKYKFSENIPLPENDKYTYFDYVKKIFQDIVGFNKFANGFWATKGDAIAYEIINKCDELNLKPEQLITFLQEKLTDIHATPSSGFIRNLPTTNGNTAMRILHCIDILGGKICNTAYTVPEPPSITQRLRYCFS